MGTVGQTEQTLHRDSQLNRKRKFLHNGSSLNIIQEPVGHHAREVTTENKQEGSSLESSPLIYQPLLIPDEECLAEAEAASFDIVAFREGCHLFGGDVYITGVPTKIYLTTYRVSLLDPTAIVNMQLIFLPFSTKGYPPFSICIEAIRHARLLPIPYQSRFSLVCDTYLNHGGIAADRQFNKCKTVRDIVKQKVGVRNFDTHEYKECQVVIL